MKRVRILLMVIALILVVCMIALAQTTGDNPPAPTDWFVIIAGALLALSEILALIPGVASNSIFMLIVNILRKLTGRPPLAAAVPQNTKIYGEGK